MRDFLYNEREILFDYACLLREKNISIKGFVKSFIQLVVNKYALFGAAHEVMFFNTVQRKDHVEFYNLVYNQCEFDKGNFDWCKKRGINLKALLMFFKYIFRMRELRRIEIPQFSDNCNDKNITVKGIMLLQLYTKLIKNLVMKEYIKKYDWKNIKVLVTLYDIGKPEHFVVNRANDMGVKTVVLQHGIMLPNFNYKDLDTYNMFKVPSRYFLALGQDIKLIASKFGSDTEVIVCGQIKNIQNVSEINKDVIGIAGNIPADYKYNMKMIQIAEKFAHQYNKKVFIRLHPTDREENYNLDTRVSSFNKDIGCAYVILAYRTSMIFTYMLQGKCVMRYKGGAPYFKLSDDILFESFDEFEKKMRNIGNVDFVSIAKEHIDCVGEESALKYREAFKKIYYD